MSGHNWVLLALELGPEPEDKLNDDSPLSVPGVSQLWCPVKPLRLDCRTMMDTTLTAYTPVDVTPTDPHHELSSILSPGFGLGSVAGQSWLN